jgi:hypothetical protein
MARYRHFIVTAAISMPLQDSRRIRAGEAALGLSCILRLIGCTEKGECTMIGLGGIFIRQKSSLAIGLVKARSYCSKYPSTCLTCTLGIVLCVVQQAIPKRAYEE